MGFSIDIGMEEVQCRESAVVHALEVNEAMAGLEHVWVDFVLVDQVKRNIESKIELMSNVRDASVRDYIGLEGINTTMKVIGNEIDTTAGIEGAMDIIKKVWKAIKKIALKVLSWIVHLMKVISSAIKNLFKSGKKAAGKVGDATVNVVSTASRLAKLA